MRGTVSGDFRVTSFPARSFASLSRLGVGLPIAALIATGLAVVPQRAVAAAPAEAGVVAPVTDPGVTKPQVSQLAEAVAADGELTDRRTEFTRTYQDGDGSLRTVVGAQPLNVPDAEGVLAPVDTTLVPATGEDASVAAGTVVAPDAAFVTASGRTVLSVPGEGDGTVRVSDGGGTWVGAELVDGDGTPVVKGSTATVRDALPGVDVSWTSTVAGLKEDLTLKSAQSANVSRFALTLSDGLTPVLAGGQVEAVDASGTSVWTMPAPFMDDAAGAHSDAVAYALDRTDAGWALTVTADPAWLADPARQFPVVVDPTILLSAAGAGVTQDLACALASDAAATASCTASSFEVGAPTGGVLDRAAIRFPQLNTQVPADAILAQADLHLPVTADSLAEPGGTCGTGPVRCTTFTYDGNGQRATTTYPTSPSTVMTTTYDDSGRTTRIKAVSGTTTHQDLSYTYGALVGSTMRDANRINTRVDNTATGTVGKTTTYTYDTQARLLQALEKDGGGTDRAKWAYTYDNQGNRLTATTSAEGAIGSGLTQYAYNAAEQLDRLNGSTTGWAYDANGNNTTAANNTSTSTWNTKDQLTAFTVSGVTSNNTYSGVGQSTAFKLGNITLRNSAVGLTNVQGGPNNFQNQVIRDPLGALIALRSGTATSGNSRYYVTDILGSVTALINNTGTAVATYQYDPYGRTRTATGPDATDNNFRYTGAYIDNTTGLYKFGARFYDPSTGRFTQPDPSGQENNQYMYASGDPINRTDVLGTKSESYYLRYNHTVDLASALAAGVAIGAYATNLLDGSGVAAPVGAVTAAATLLSGLAAAVVSDRVFQTPSECPAITVYTAFGQIYAAVPFFALCR